MAAIASTQAGDWGTGSTWVGGSKPVSGDTVTITHAVTCDGSETCGTSPATGGTTALTVSGSGTLTIAGTLVVRGPISQDNAPITVSAGGVLEYDSSAAASPSTTYYEHKIGANHNQTSARLYLSGTSSSARAVVRSNSGGGNGFISSGGWLQGGAITGTWAQFLRVGDSSNIAVQFWPSSTKHFTLSDTLFTDGGRLNNVSAPDSGADFSLQRVTFSGTVSSSAMRFDSSSGTGLRLIDGCVFDKYVEFYPPTGLTLTDNVFVGRIIVTSGTWTEFSGNFVSKAVMDPNLVGGATSGNYWHITSDVASNPHFFQVGSAVGTYSADGDVFDYGGTDAAGDAILLGAPSSALTLTVKNCLVLPNRGTGASGTLVSALGNANCTFSVDHCTVYMSGQQAITVGETYAGHAGMCTGVKNSLFVGLGAGSARFKVADSGSNDSVSDLVSSANLNYNGGYNLSTGSNGNGYDALEFSSGSPGANDISADPQFFASTRNLATWDASLGGAGTDASAITNLKAKTTGYTPAALLTWVKAGFAPQNVVYQGAANDAGDIGAISFYTGSAPILMGQAIF